MNGMEIGITIFLIVFVAMGFYFAWEKKRDLEQNLHYVMVNKPDLIDEIFLTETHRVVLRHLIAGDEKGMTAAELAEELEINAGAARNRLKHLYDKKYLKREKAGSPRSGGEFIYYPLSF